MKFFQAARPEKKIRLRARKIGEVGELLQFEVEALIDNTLVAAGQLVLNALPTSG
jgi:3-hydroxymyristoyl/3-hydroxydecanoyl-(acyl carrier protein) dehydratase